MPIKWADEPPKSRIRWEDPPAPVAAPVVAAPAPVESREDELRRKAQEDIVAGMSTGEKLALGFDRGITRLGQSLKQIALHSVADNPIVSASKALLPDAADANIDRLLNATGAPQAAKDYDAQLQRENQQYQEGAGKSTAAAVGDFVGTTAATLPLGGPVARGGGVLANAALAAVPAGVASAALTPVDDGSDFAAAKRRQAAIGAAVGGGASAVMQGAGYLAERAGLGNLVRAGFNAVGGKSVDKPEAIASEAAAKKWGVPLSPGKITGNQQQLAIENTVGQSIWQRNQMLEQDMLAANKYAEAISKNLDALGKGSVDTVAAGNSVKDSINKAINRLTRGRSKMATADFAAVDELARGAPVIDPTNYRTVAQQIIDENSVAPKGSDARALADAAKELLESAADNGKAANALKTRRYLSQIAGGQASFAGSAGQPIQKRAAAMLLSALDNDIDAATKNVARAAADDGTSITLYHGSPGKVDAIKDSGTFGGIFGSPNRGAAASHGAVVHEVRVPKEKVLTQRDLDYEVDPDVAREFLRKEVAKDATDEELDEVWKAVIDDKGTHGLDLPDERVAELFRSDDLGEAGWEAQRIRGALAKKLGYQAVEMADEHGTTYLALPGASIFPEGSATSGPSLGEALKLANDRYKAYSKRIADIEDGVLGRLLGPDLGTDLKRVAGETIYKRFTEMPPSQLSQAMKLLKPESAEAVKRAYVEKALNAAKIEKTNTAAQAAMTPSTFVKALQGDGETGAADRATLKAIFSDSEMKELDELMDIGRRLGDRTGRNTSESTVRAETVGLVTKIKDGLLKWGVSTLGQALGAREIAKIYANAEGRKALLRIRKLPKGSAEARQLAAYLSGLAAAEEADE